MFSKCAFRVSGGRFQKCNRKKNLLPMIQERPIHCYIGNIPLQFKFNCYWIIIRHPVYNLALWSTNLNSPVAYQSDSKFFLFRGASTSRDTMLTWQDNLHFSLSDHTLFDSIVTILNHMYSYFCLLILYHHGGHPPQISWHWYWEFHTLDLPPCW